ncbi:MAG: hypothetical protein KJO26_13305 [Deltaproteobacteria bacterium]|nr:hypothetical protein [Deltaproteobacteria bacterium]
MILMGTYTMPNDKTEEWKKCMFDLAANPPTVGIKKWQTFSCSYEFGYKGYNLIFTEKGQEDEALLEIAKTMFPLTQIEGTSWKLEPLMTVPDSLKILG